MPAVIAAVAGHGFAANVVSRGEWAAATRAGLPNDRITLEGIGKTHGRPAAAVRAARDGRPLRWIAIESPEEAAALATLAARGPAVRRSTSCTGSTPTSPRRRWPVWPLAPAARSSG